MFALRKGIKPALGLPVNYSKGKFNMASFLHKWLCTNNHLFIEPLTCLHDEIVHVEARGLKPHQNVTLRSSTFDSRGIEFFAYAHYSANISGLVDVREHASTGGHYAGIFPMGLVGCLQPSPEYYRYLRFLKRDVETPLKVTFNVYDGHLSAEELFHKAHPSPLDSKDHLRSFMAPGVRRVPVQDGRLHATLFIPSGEGPFPGVVDMFGTAGGLLEFRAAQLASRGIASLALAYFDYKDLSPDVSEFELSYFEEAVNYLLKQEEVKKPAVGVIAVSKGGDLALSMATFIQSPAVGAVVWINGCCSPIVQGLRLPNGTSIDPLPLNLSAVTIEDGEVLNVKATCPPAEECPDSIIPIEKSDASFLFLVGLDDRNTPATEYVKTCIARLANAGKTNYEVVRLPGAGHLVEPPYSPHAYATYHKLFHAPVIWGGNAREHMSSQEYAWAVTLSFMKRTLGKKT